MYTIRHATILTVDEEDHVYPDGAMTVGDDGRILQIGKSDEIRYEGEVIEMRGKIVLPGFVNAHLHSHLSLLRNWNAYGGRHAWLQQASWEPESAFDADLAFDATVVTCLESIKSGVTTYMDQAFYTGDIAWAVMQSGLRGFLATSISQETAENEVDSLALAAEFAESWSGREEQTRVYPCFGPISATCVSREQIREIVSLAKRYRSLIQIHLCDSEEENRVIEERCGMTPAHWLDRAGLLTDRTLAISCVHLTEEELDLLAKRRVSAVYTPIGNMITATGVMPVQELLKRGIRIAIGTGSAQNSHSQDLLNAMKTGALIQKMLTKDPTFLPARQCIRMMTIEGAKALGIGERTGSLKTGKMADFIALDAASPNLMPLIREDVNDLYLAIIYSAVGADVSDTVVEGQWLMRDGKVLTLDEEDVCRRAQRAVDRLLSGR